MRGCKTLTNYVIITVKQARASEDSGIYTLGVEKSGADLQVKLKIQVTLCTGDLPSGHYVMSGADAEKVQRTPTYLKLSSLEDTVMAETGYMEPNLWLDWVFYSAKNLQKSNCYACSTTRPTFGTEDTHQFRQKRETPAGSFDNSIYINSIGVPRGVQEEFKAQNQIAAGF